MDSLTERAIAYYPGETPVFDGGLVVTTSDNNEVDLPYADVVVPDDESLNISMTWLVQHPLRTQYSGFFLRRVGNVMVCNVDLELPEQPSLEIVAGVLIAAMTADETQA
jgi:hypothetical protein